MAVSIHKRHVTLPFLIILFVPMSAVPVASGRGYVSTRLWIDINMPDKAIKELCVPLVTTG